LKELGESTPTAVGSLESEDGVGTPPGALMQSVNTESSSLLQQQLSRQSSAMPHPKQPHVILYLQPDDETGDGALEETSTDDVDVGKGVPATTIYLDI
jgi:hypothetical protein